MLQLEELQFQWIGRFVTKQVTKFSSLGNFIQVDGRNNNTGGSSGAAKSTLFNALDYLLGLGGKPATVLQSRKLINPEENSIWVQGTFNLNGIAIVIVRSKSIIRITIGGETFEKSKAEEKIDELLGMPRDLFRKIIHKRQGEGGFFLNFSPGEMHDFLMDCIGLSPFKKHYSAVDARIKDLELYKTGVENDVKYNQVSLNSMQDAILALGLAPVQDIHREVILELKEKSDRSAIRLADVKSKCESIYNESEKSRPDTTNRQYDGTARENLEKRRKEIDEEISDLHTLEQKRQGDVRLKIHERVQQKSAAMVRVDQGHAAKKSAERIASDIRSIRAQECPTCHQGWATESASLSEKAKLAELADIKEIITDSAHAENESAGLDQEISALKSSLSPITSPQEPILNEELANITELIIVEKRKAGELYEQQSAETKAKLDAFMAGQAELRKKHDLEIEQARGQADIDRRVLDTAVQKLRAYEESKSRYEQTVNELNKKAEFFTKQLEKYRIDLESTIKELNFALETKKAIKMYVSFSFDDALEAIGDKATKIIRCIPNTSNATIQFEGTKETQKGTVKEEVNAVISADGESGVPIKSLSGGERSAVDLAVDLAVIDYIESKTGKGLNLFILDEPFTGLGTVEIEMALEVLKNSNTNKKLTIVDHNPEVKQMVQDRLVVVRDGLTSKVQ